ncbi:MAG: protoporphyrin/coproporphyrin ferrochelatase [Actinomycetota bacterium]|nr:protoporphyrin/coproporphyrin ferrochelatase [Actinomycetota bacterium]
MPFLERVTAGGRVPPERLSAVAEEYRRGGGRSPLNDLNRQLLAALRAELDRRGLGAGLYWGNLHAAPFLGEALHRAHSEGIRRLVVLTTSAYSSDSGCGRYRRALHDALAEVNSGSRPHGDLGADVVRPWFNHPAHVEQCVELLVGTFPADPDPDRVRVLFVTHSIPEEMNDRSGPAGNAYVAQHRDVAATVADLAGRDLGIRVGWDLVYCSRSGRPEDAWLEPDIRDHLRRLDPRVRQVVVAPIGFTADHWEVLSDLDLRARQTAYDQGLDFRRVPTVGSGPVLVRGLVDLLTERAALARGEDPDRPALGRLGPAPAICPEGCCQEAVS